MKLEGLATLVIRLYGGYNIVRGIAQLVFPLFDRYVLGQDFVDPVMGEFARVAIVHFVLSFLVIGFSRPLGRLLARGLE